MIWKPGKYKCDGDHSGARRWAGMLNRGLAQAEKTILIKGTEAGALGWALFTKRPQNTSTRLPDMPLQAKDGLLRCRKLSIIGRHTVRHPLKTPDRVGATNSRALTATRNEPR